MNVFFLLIMLVLLVHSPLAGQDPFAKIIITSQQATCQRDEKDSHLIAFTYEKNVKVRLSDGSVIRAKKLEIKLKDEARHEVKPTPTPIKKASHFEKIILTGNVRIKKEHRSARADVIEIYPENYHCVLKGNVVIKQNKKDKKFPPITTRGEHARLDLKTYQVSLEGSQQTPVSTFIRLGEQPVEKPSSHTLKTIGSEHDKNKNTLSS